jgi:colanic acid/amylovoran biosynthesis protein WcaK/AmsJ
LRHRLKPHRTILITGITGLRNRGVEALAGTTVRELSHRLPGCRILLLTGTPDYDQTRFDGQSVLTLQSPTRRDRRVPPRLVPWLWPLAGRFPIGRLADSLRSCSAVVASGGDVFSSDYGGLENHLYPLNCAVAAGVPVIFLAQSIGPFRAPAEAHAWLRVARRARLTTVRESLSYRYVTDELGLDSAHVRQTADPAFLLEPPAPSRLAELLASHGINAGRPVVALAPSCGISRYSRLDPAEHLRAWRSVIDFFVLELGTEVVLIPHVQERHPANDDRILVRELVKLAAHPAVRAADGDYSASELKGIIGACEFAVAERMHAGIAGLSSGVCTVLVGYSVKARGIMSDLQQHIGLGEPLQLPIEDLLRAERAIPALRRAWQIRRQVAVALGPERARLRVAAAEGFDLVAQAIESGRGAS